VQHTAARKALQGFPERSMHESNAVSVCSDEEGAKPREPRGVKLPCEMRRPVGLAALTNVIWDHFIAALRFSRCPVRRDEYTICN
jgi:hypothetical protein